MRLRQNGRYFADNILNSIFLNENIWIPIKVSLKFVPKGPIDNIPSLVQIMAWRRSGDKPLSEPMTVSLPTHICFVRRQWVKLSIGYSPEPWQTTLLLSLKFRSASFRIPVLFISHTAWMRAISMYLLQPLAENLGPITLTFFFFFYYHNWNSIWNPYHCNLITNHQFTTKFFTSKLLWQFG